MIHTACIKHLIALNCGIYRPYRFTEIVCYLLCPQNLLSRRQENKCELGTELTHLEITLLTLLTNEV